MRQIHLVLTTLFCTIPVLTVISEGTTNIVEISKDSNSLDSSFNTSQIEQSPENKQYKRQDELGTFAAMVKGLTQKIAALGLDHIIDNEYFSKLIQKGMEKELEQIFKCSYRSFSSEHGLLTNIAHRYRGSEAEIAFAKEGLSGMNGFVYEDPSAFVLLGIICGSSHWLPDTEHSAKVGKKLLNRTRELFSQHHSKRWGPETYLDKAWKSIEGNTNLGGVTTLYATITPKKKLEVANLGQSWAGLYRESKLEYETYEKIHEDHSPYHLCKTYGIFEPEHSTDSARDSRKNIWQAKAGDILIMVSKSVREALTPDQIYQGSTFFEKSGLPNNSFVGASVGILRGARSASANNEMIAVAAKIA